MLITFGELKLEDKAYGQPKALLLLSYLALEGKQHRSRLARLFWPHNARGRENLSALLYKIKRVPQLADYLETNKQTIACTVPVDVQTLHKALEQDNLAKVRQIYKGAFCQHLYIDSVSEELEEWLYSTRETLAYKVHKLWRKTAISYARQGNWLEAADYAKQSHQVAGLGELSPNELADIYQLLQATKHSYSKVILKELQELGASEIITSHTQNFLAEKPSPVASLVSADNPYAHFIHNVYDLSQLHSRSYRDSHARDWLHKYKDSVTTLVLRQNAWGHFLEDVQAYVAQLALDNPKLSYLVLDCEHLNPHDYEQLSKVSILHDSLREQGIDLLLASHYLLEHRRSISRHRLIPADLWRYVYHDSDRALTFCEEQILASSKQKSAAVPTVKLADFQLLSHLQADEVAIFRDLCKKVFYARGTFIIKMGDIDSSLYVLTRGIVDITLGDEDIYRRRINQQVAGSVFGELAFLNTTTRTANVEAVSDCQCLVLGKSALNILRQKHPQLHHKLAQEFNELLVHRVKYLTHLR